MISRGYLTTKHPAKWSMCRAHDWNSKSQYRWRQLCFASILRVRPSRETPAKHSVLPDCTIWYTLSVPALYIPILPTNDKECFWEKTLVKHLESKRLSYPYIFTHKLVDFLNCYLSISYYWEVDSLKTYHTLSECQERFWYYWEALEEAKDGRCNIELVVGSKELDKTRFQEALLE